MTSRTLDLGPGVGLYMHEIGDGNGPTLAVLGGVHGDEIEGVAAARMLINLAELLDAQGLLRGTLRVVPVCNPPAFEARTRTSPLDGENLARVFPGDASASVTKQIAHALTERVIRGADLLVDLHSAGVHYSMPLFVGFVDHLVTSPMSREAATAFGAPLTWQHEGSGPGRSLSAAADLGVPSIYVEGSGGGGLAGTDLDTYVRGLTRLLAHFGMGHETPGPHIESAWLSGDDGDVDSSLASDVAGYCVTRSVAGDVVSAGQVIAEIIDDAARVVQEIVNPRPGPATVMMLRQTAIVTPGDAIAMLGPAPIAAASL
ncbi:unannotated protein [freshwater metagenome]|uniref:Unannotated protein n=1 Tax=freshwater metagenome TaxID=449393 RepID=A0A6J7I3U8_9ZZZZ|nr:hypothetical protein [Actinomycetota bacterium]